MRPCLTIMNYPGIRLEGLRNIAKILSQDSTTLDLNLNLGLSEFKAGMLTDFSVRHYEDMDYIFYDINGFRIQ